MDLAARNILLHTNNTVKIGDFGLTRPFDEGKTYWLMKETLRLAVKWIPPDALKSKRFGEPTDVWAFGVCLWEIFAMGATPFKEVQLCWGCLRTRERGGACVSACVSACVCVRWRDREIDSRTHTRTHTHTHTLVFAGACA